MQRIKQTIKKILLSILQLFTKRRGITIHINDFTLRLPAAFYNYYEKNYESSNFHFLKKRIKPGNNIIDVGAHIGIYSLYAAKYLQATAFAFEPSPDTKEKLDKNILMNNCSDRITTFQFAVADKNEPVTFYLNERMNEANIRTAEANALFTRTVKDVHTESIAVNCITLDTFAKDYQLKIDFIKIDAEGAELEVLKGAKEILQHHRPAGIVGIHTFFYKDVKANLLELSVLMQQLNYQLLFNDEILEVEDLLKLAKDELFDLHFIPAEAVENI